MKQESSPGDEVRLAFEGPVATITIDRPAVRNAMDRNAWTVLADHMEAVARSDARVLVLTGAGGHFCAGADTSARRRADLHPLDRLGHVTAPLVALQELPLPVVAKVDGPAVGAGLSLALTADLVVATTRSRFGTAFARRGLSLDTGSSWLLPRVVGLQAAKRLAYLAETLDAEEARRLGLVTWLVPPGEADAFTDDLALRLAAAPPVAVRLDKELLGRSHERSFREAVAAENVAQVVNIGTDSPTAREAHARGERPVFTGRWRG
ncbi:2-(1,2-epoxy-1,2-dihydrophenyl)acetyl-CoA isomerase [Actinomadura coerulea]|uniref:2-(1,2-epoxy-1,2-dihydrophenyl)acetyl-CoA isomerase n=1 Tax=Actinomadura coerulea TaxID=46159 RepID=A0A7X0KYR6_9ACTN|nr:2-(1,2-epoxy-1,2-dihydrophenyl)acetyl-CoA isomerase [Actinomadura coerulea]GGQ26415.1 enoyl-CoA hydratase [Actinomadura coerulea]